MCIGGLRGWIDMCILARTKHGLEDVHEPGAPALRVLSKTRKCQVFDFGRGRGHEPVVFVAKAVELEVRVLYMACPTAVWHVRNVLVDLQQLAV